MAAGVTHVPEPLQVDAPVAEPSVQLAAWHSIELPGIRQAVAFVPSHCPLHFPDPVQAVRVPRGSPWTVLQVPTLLVSSHAWHVPSHLSLQQTPSTQWPSAHCESIVHEEPFDRVLAASDVDVRPPGAGTPPDEVMPPEEMGASAVDAPPLAIGASEGRIPPEPPEAEPSVSTPVPPAPPPPNESALPDEPALPSAPVLPPSSPLPPVPPFNEASSPLPPVPPLREHVPAGMMQ